MQESEIGERAILRERGKKRQDRAGEIWSQEDTETE